MKTQGIGNYSLWFVSYQEGERWPHCLYDAANDAFIPLGDASALAAFDAVDLFYNAEVE